MQRSIWSRIGPGAGVLLGLGGVMLLVVLLGALFGQDLGYVSPRESAEAVSGFLEANSDRFREMSVIRLGLAALLMIFVADLFERLRGALPESARWLSIAFLAGGLLFASGLVLSAALGYGASTIHDFGEDLQTARALHAMSTDSLGAIIPGVAVMTATAAAASLGFRALPRWLGVLALVAFAVNLAAYWVPGWALWILATSTVLLIRPDAAPLPASERRVQAVSGSGGERRPPDAQARRLPSMRRQRPDVRPAARGQEATWEPGGPCQSQTGGDAHEGYRAVAHAFRRSFEERGEALSSASPVPACALIIAEAVLGIPLKTSQERGGSSWPSRRCIRRRPSSAASSSTLTSRERPLCLPPG